MATLQPGTRNCKHSPPGSSHGLPNALVEPSAPSPDGTYGLPNAIVEPSAPFPDGTYGLPNALVEPSAPSPGGVQMGHINMSPRGLPTAQRRGNLQHTSAQVVLDREAGHWTH